MKEFIKLNHLGYKNWQQWWFDDGFVLKYANKMIYKSNHKKKDMSKL